MDCHASRLCGRLQTAHTLQNVPDYYNKEEELHMNQFTKAVKSLAAQYNETSLIQQQRLPALSVSVQN